MPLESIKVFGRSIGTGPVLALAAKYDFAGVILVTPFADVRTLFRDRVGPLADFVDEWFPNMELIKTVRSSTMVIHGRDDHIIPCHHGDMVYKACTARKLFINPAKMEHNCSLAGDISFFIAPMFHFFSLPDYSFHQDLVIPPWAFVNDSSKAPGGLSNIVDKTSGSANGVPGAGEERVYVEQSFEDSTEPTVHGWRWNLCGATQAFCSHTIIERPEPRAAGKLPQRPPDRAGQINEWAPDRDDGVAGQQRVADCKVAATPPLGVRNSVNAGMQDDGGNPRLGRRSRAQYSTAGRILDI